MRRSTASGILLPGTQSELIEQIADLSSILGGTLLTSIEEVDLVSLLGELGAELQTKEPPGSLCEPAKPEP